MNNGSQTRFVNRMRLVPDDLYDVPRSTTSNSRTEHHPYLGDLQQMRRLFQPSTQQAYQGAEKQYTDVLRQPIPPNYPPYLRQQQITDAMENFRHMENIYKQQAQQIKTTPTDELLTRLITVMEEKIVPSLSSSKPKKPRLKVSKRYAPTPQSAPIAHKRPRVSSAEQQPADDEFVLADEDQGDAGQEGESMYEATTDQSVESPPEKAKTEEVKKNIEPKGEQIRGTKASNTRRQDEIPSGTADIKNRLRSTTQRAAGMPWYSSVIKKPVAWVNIRHIGN